jgi:hypothetical protein
MGKKEKWLAPDVRLGPDLRGFPEAWTSSGLSGTSGRWETSSEEAALGSESDHMPSLEIAGIGLVAFAAMSSPIH